MGKHILFATRRHRDNQHMGWHVDWFDLVQEIGTVIIQDKRKHSVCSLQRGNAVSFLNTQWEAVATV